MSSSGSGPRPTPGDLVPVRGRSTAGSQGDGRVEEALTRLRSAVDKFAGRENQDSGSIQDAGSETAPRGEDAVEVVEAGRSLHDALQQRLDEAAE